ncbi:MAG: hypothetical protein FVQ81_09940 [Candidatus Glassbacteria bacterium]|nr:hypothetical protein [Candidatus Glassbacteria bacterium]
MRSRLRSGRIQVLSGLIFLLCANFTPATPSHPLSCAEQTGALLAAGDTTGALAALDNKLRANNEDHAALLERGWLRLELDRKDLAAEDFKLALGSESGDLRISAYIGLAWCSHVPGKRRSVAMGYIRRALAVDSGSKEALYAKTMIMLDFEPTTDDVRVAKRALFRLLETDFTYRDAYRLWRDVVMDRTDKEIRKVDKLLAAYLDTHPDSASWRLDLAWDRYLVESAQAALDELAALENLNPEFSHPDQLLLKSRCRLESGDTLAFQSLYWQAVDLAGQTGQFDRLITEAATIFTPEDQDRFEQAVADGARQKFLHFF